MANVALRGIPDHILDALKRSAKQNHRSLNGEILARLEASTRSAGVDPRVILDRIHERAARRRIPELTEDLLRELKEAGRP